MIYPKHLAFLLFSIVCMAALPSGALAQKNLPTIAITTSESLNPRKKLPAHMKAENYDGPIGIKLRGNSSLSFNQKKYTLETGDADGKELDVGLLGLPAHSDWVLLAPYNDVSMVRDPLAFHLWRGMGHWGPRTVMCELTMNDEYRGIYILSEAIKRGYDHVNISKLKKSDTTGSEVTGRKLYMSKYNAGECYLIWNERKSLYDIGLIWKDSPNAKIDIIKEQKRLFIITDFRYLDKRLKKDAWTADCRMSSALPSCFWQLMVRSKENDKAEYEKLVNTMKKAVKRIPKGKYRESGKETLDFYMHY